MIVVMGASGRVGRQIVARLRDAGEDVRALGRSAERLAEAARRGAAVLTGDACDARFLTEAFRGADAVFTLLAEDVHAEDFRAHQDAQGEAIAAAIRESGIAHVVFLSSIGADLPDGTGPIAGLHAQEERLRQLPGVHVLILRAAYFFENFDNSLALIKEAGMNGGPIAADVPIPMIATRDIADVAARALRRRDWHGVVVRELLGERDLTFAEATRLIGTRLGKPDVPYVPFPYSDVAASLAGMGFSKTAADSYVEMARALNEGRLKPQAGRSPENTTPTPFEAYADAIASESPPR